MNITKPIVTVIIPTHDRKEELHKLLDYYLNFDEKIHFIICDSSKDKNDNIHSRFQYFHLPDSPFATKVYEVLKYVKTDYVILAADDDFLIEKTIFKLLQKRNSYSYSMMQGLSYAYRENFDGNVYFRNDPISRRNIKGSSKRRIRKYFSSYYTCLWSMVKTEVLRMAFQFLNEKSFSNDNFIEIVIALTSCLNGDIYVSSDVWNIRRIDQSSSWGERTENISDIINDENHSDLIKIKELIMEKSKKECFYLFLACYRIFLSKSSNSISLKFILKIKNILSRKNCDIINFISYYTKRGD